MMLHHIVYVVEIGQTSAGERMLYVGSTGLTAEERLAQHRRGYKANKEVMKAKEVRLRPDLAPRGPYDGCTVQRKERETYHFLKGQPGTIVFGS